MVRVAPRGGGAIVGASIALALGALGACVLADPPADLPVLPVEPPVIRLRLQVALALASGAARVPGAPAMPTPEEVRASSLNWAFRNTKAKRELGWRPSPHEDCLEETVAWYRENAAAAAVSPPGTRQPLALRLAAGAARRTGVLGK